MQTLHFTNFAAFKEKQPFGLIIRLLFVADIFRDLFDMLVELVWLEPMLQLLAAAFSIFKLQSKQ